MIRIIRIPAILVVACVATLSPSTAGASHGDIHPTFKSASVFFHCPGGRVYAWPTQLWAPWDSTAPAGPLSSQGCVGVDYGPWSTGYADVNFAGTFVGNLRDLTVRIHQLLLGNARIGQTETLRLNAWIDGVPIFPPGSLPTHGRNVTLTPVRSADGRSELLEFSITNIGYAEEIRDATGNVIGVQTGGFAYEDGDGKDEHELRIAIGLAGGTPVQPPGDPKVGLFAWDATEVPGGITFNPSALAAATVPADRPNPQA